MHAGECSPLLGLCSGDGGEGEEHRSDHVRELEDGCKRETESERVKPELGRIREQPDHQVIKIEYDVISESEDEERTWSRPSAASSHRIALGRRRKQVPCCSQRQYAQQPI